MHIKKHRAGADSFGNEWTRHGAVIEVPDEQGRELLTIPGFTEVFMDDDTDDDSELRTEMDEAPKPRRHRPPRKPNPVTEPEPDSDGDKRVEE